jgi:hypothetical protein
MRPIRSPARQPTSRSGKAARRPSQRR